MAFEFIIFLGKPTCLYVLLPNITLRSANLASCNVSQVEENL